MNSVESGDHANECNMLNPEFWTQGSGTKIYPESLRNKLSDVRAYLRVRLFGKIQKRISDLRSKDCSASKKKQNPKKDYFPRQRRQTNPELRANFKNKKKIAVKFVLEKFLGPVYKQVGLP